ncbi:dienelactone hydrolase family protein [Phycicoccus sp. 3266]|uniref:dienelactone hydrolase family protein n=1 Tax=Phycicoccus sp. 3266 TaxID=2817751 RepID=UPI002863063E|nr:dienelactone hydrolase family protein [Phycicoccus sp. 3266]MDR6863305.1 dienelactone hydrolase [Phycicoccus sp. 3266]
MTEIVLFHHIQGLTSGVVAFADALREAGHTVHTPDMFEGRTFESIEAGQAYCGEVGFEEVRERGVRAVQDLPQGLVYAGFSLGCMPAQKLLQGRPGALAGLFYHGFADPSWFGAWPEGTPAQIHAMDADPFFVEEGDLEAARPFVESHDEVELFLYPGDGHLFADNTLADYDAGATKLVLERSLALLERL